MSKLTAFARRALVPISILVAACSASSGPSLSTDPEPGELALVVSRASLVVAEGTVGSFSVRLNRAPDPGLTAGVTVDFLSGSGSFRLNGATSFTFDGSDWNVARTVEVESLDDADQDNDTGQLQVLLDAGADALFVALTQLDGDGDPAPGDGIAFVVKDASGSGAVDQPMSVVIPFERGAFSDTTGFSIEDASGDPVPAQFQVLNRWWAVDGSIRHVLCHFLGTVPGDGQATFRLRTDGENPAPSAAVSVADSAGTLSITNGYLRIDLAKSSFNLFDSVWFDPAGAGTWGDAQRIVAGTAADGPVLTPRAENTAQDADGEQKASARTPTWVVEESGPVRACIRVSALTDFNSTTDHTHGWAVRLYVYAGSTSVKVDYQLQNSANDVRFSWPLYFEDCSIGFQPLLDSPTVRVSTEPGDVWQGTVGGGRYLFQSGLHASQVRNSSDNSLVRSGTGGYEKGQPNFAWCEVADATRGVAVVTRHFAQEWPNGYEVSADGRVHVRLWPRWSAQHFPNGTINSSGLFWLNDMQHVVREVLVDFHGSGTSAGALDDLARRFEYPPVAFVPPAVYDRTGATFDLDSVFPRDDVIPTSDPKRLSFSAAQLDEGNASYNFGIVNYGGHVGRKDVVASGGGVPASCTGVVATQSVAEWLACEFAVMGELNLRNESMEGYDHDAYDDALDLGYDVDAASRWGGCRACVLGTEPNTPQQPNTVSPYLSGTAHTGWKPRDPAHGWWYEREEWFYLTGNYWVRDWYVWRSKLALTYRSDPDPAGWNLRSLGKGWAFTRDDAHLYANFVAAWEITGDERTFAHLKDVWYQHVERWRDDTFSVWRIELGEAPFMVGFWTRIYSRLLADLAPGTPSAPWRDDVFRMWWGQVDWNDQHAGYGYYATDMYNHAYGDFPSSGTATQITDGVALFIQKTGRTEYTERLTAFIDTGLNGGGTAYWSPRSWGDLADGDHHWWVHRVTQDLYDNPRIHVIPDAVSDLSAERAGDTVTLRWTTPAQADRLMVFYSIDKPITLVWNQDPDQRKVWACQVVDDPPAAAPGSTQSVAVSGVPAGATVYGVVYTFSADGGMSPPSNVVTRAP